MPWLLGSPLRLSFSVEVQIDRYLGTLCLCPCLTSMLSDRYLNMHRIQSSLWVICLRSSPDYPIVHVCNHVQISCTLYMYFAYLYKVHVCILAFISPTCQGALGSSKSTRSFASRKVECQAVLHATYVHCTSYLPSRLWGWWGAQHGIISLHQSLMLVKYLGS